MNAGRFATLSRSLQTDSRRGAFRTIGVLGVAGLATQVRLSSVGARKKRGGKKKDKKKKTESCPECICPAATVCPPPDNCPARICCICNSTTSPTPGACKYAPDPSGTADILEACDAACGGPGTFFSGARSSPGWTIACNFTGTGCMSAGCPT